MTGLKIAAVLLITILSASAEYRTWTSNKGRSIEAEYRGMNGSKAVLLRKDGKKIEVDPAKLSAEDQAYLKEMAAPGDETSDAEAGESKEFISAAEATAIAEKYVEAINEQNVDKWKSLMLDPDRSTERSFKLECTALNIKRARLKEVDRREHGYDARIEVVYANKNSTGASNEVEASRWMQMDPNGKIKYDDIVFEHPVKQAVSFLSTALYRAKNEMEYSDAEKLKATGVPLFGYDTADDYDDQVDALKKLKDWLEDDCKGWDATDPKVGYPRDAHKIWIREFNQLSSYY